AFLITCVMKCWRAMSGVRAKSWPAELGPTGRCFFWVVFFLFVNFALPFSLHPPPPFHFSFLLPFPPSLFLVSSFSFFLSFLPLSLPSFLSSLFFPSTLSLPFLSPR